MFMRKSIQVRLDWLGIIALIVSIIALIISTYLTRYSLAGLQNAETAVFEFKTTGSQTGIISIAPSSGTIFYGMNQVSGNSVMRYSSKYKRSTSSVWTGIYNNGYFPSNNTYIGPFYAFVARSIYTYNFALQKTAGNNTYSKVICDVMLH